MIRSRVKKRPPPFGRTFGAKPRLRAMISCGVLALVSTLPAPAQSQVLSGVIGGVGGLVAGAYTTTGIYVLKSRATGWVMHSVEHLVEPGPATIPLVAGPVAGAIVGARSSSTLRDAGLWGGVGMASGAVAGALAGQLIWGDAEGRWAGGVIGSATGLVAGIVAGALTSSDAHTDGDTLGVPLRFSFALPWPGAP